VTVARYRKALAALFGSLTPAVVVGVLALLHVNVDPTLAAGTCTACGALATLLAPANATTPPPPATLSVPLPDPKVTP
jgi:hypothetical protein